MSLPVQALTRKHLDASDSGVIAGRYTGKTAVILASGPSLSAIQIGACNFRAQQKHCVVFTVNSTWQRFPHADVHFSNDCDWYALNLDAMRKDCRGEFWCSYPDHGLSGVYHIPFDKTAPGLSSSHRGAIAWAGNSGAACISLAVLSGCTRILLAGFDQMGDHWHDPHPEAVRKPPNWPMWAERLSQMAKDAARQGIEIINCSEQTSLTCFERGDLAKELAKCSRY